METGDQQARLRRLYNGVAEVVFAEALMTPLFAQFSEALEDVAGDRGTVVQREEHRSLENLLRLHGDLERLIYVRQSDDEAYRWKPSRTGVDMLLDLELPSALILLYQKKTEGYLFTQEMLEKGVRNWRKASPNIFVVKRDDLDPAHHFWSIKQLYELLRDLPSPT